MSASGDDQLAALREQRRLELQKQLEVQAKAQADAEIESQIKDAEDLAVSNAMKKLLTSDARSRITRISLANPERAESIKQMIITMYQEQKFTPPMSDSNLKSLLASQSRAAVMRQLEESEKVLEMSRNKPAAKNTPNEGYKTKPPCPSMGHVKDRPKHCVSPKETSLETQ